MTALGGSSKPRSMGDHSSLKYCSTMLKILLIFLLREGSFALKICKSSTRTPMLGEGARGMKCTQNGLALHRNDEVIGRLGVLRMASAEIPEFGDDVEEGEDSEADDRTDRDKGLSHGYEGDFKKGDNIKVTMTCTIYSVKPFLKEGLQAQGMEGEVADLVLYGRKHDSLCSAITPIKVKFQPGGVGVPPEIKRPFFLHFESSEIEKL